MNRQNLIDAIAGDAKLSKVATTRFLNSLITIVQNEVAKGGTVKLSGFGTFEKAVVAARIARHPKTGVPIKIASTCKPKFTPGITFKDLVKG